MILVIDNYDSFTYNLVQYLGELGADDARSSRNDAITVDEIVALAPERIVISPGPGNPDQAGISLEVIRRLRSDHARSSACASATRRSARRSAARWCARRRRCTARPRAIRHDGRGVFAGLAEPASRPRATTRWSCCDDGPARRPRDHRAGRGRRDHGPAPPALSRSRACSSTPSPS